MMKRFIVPILLQLCISVSALQWPVDIGFMASSFLEGDSGAVNPGLVFEGYDSMRPYDYGETIFRYVPDAYNALPGEGDSLLILEHENGFQSIYSGISPAETRQDRNRLSAGEYLKAPSGSGGLSYPSRCTFMIRDSLLNQLVNPLILLPVPDDSVSPEIESILLGDGDAYYELLGREDESIPVGNYQVYIRALDRTDSGVRQMPYSYALYNLGSLLLERELDAILLQEEGRSFKDGHLLESVFSLTSYISLGEIILTSGQSMLEITVSDVHGNESSQSIKLRVVR